MNVFFNYILFKDEIKKYEELKKSFNKNDKMSNLLKKYDDLFKHFKEIKAIEKGKFTKLKQTEDDVINDITSELKTIYFNKMNAILSSDNIKICEAYLNGLLSDLKEYKSKYFNGIVLSFITDVERTINNINEIYNNYNSCFTNYIKTKKQSLNEYHNYDDSLYEKIENYVIEVGKVSTALLQRIFNLEYNRAARMIDLLEERGVISGPNGSKPRTVLLNSRSDVKICDSSNAQTDYFSKTYGDNYKENMKMYFNKLGININYNSKTLIDFSKIDNVLFTNSEACNSNDLIKKILEFSTPYEVRLVLIDFSKINMSEYNGVPHLLTPVITDYSKATFIFQKLVDEMEYRYELFLKEKVKNIITYNNKTSKRRLPYIIVVINDFHEILKFKNDKNNISKLLLNCKNAGIIVMAFSKFKKKNIQLFMLEDLFKIYNNYSNDYFENKEINSISTMNNIDNDMDGFEFEKYVSDLLKSNGFNKVNVTQCSNDYGVDIIAFKDEVKYAIQCKKYSSPVGIKAVQEVIGSKAMNGCHVGVVLTNNTFTKSATSLAEKNNILLWDRKKLERLINNYKKNEESGK